MNTDTEINLKDSFESNVNNSDEKIEKNENIKNEDLNLNESIIQNKKPRLNKTEKKYQRYKQKLEKYKLKKAEKKSLKKELKNSQVKEKKENNENYQNETTSFSEQKKEEETLEKEKNHDEYINKRILKQKTIDRLNQVYSDPSECLKIYIDCSFDDKMSKKEMSRLAQQIGRCYATNKSISKSVHLTLCNLNKESAFYKELCRVNDGFSRYILQITEKTIDDIFSDNLNSLIYLSPDSDQYLEELDINKVYVIGGLVDETVNKKVTLTKCKSLKINSYSLPIEKYMIRKNDQDQKVYNYNKILAINQVFDILANFHINKDWSKALECGVPKRKGFISLNEYKNNLEKPE